MSLPSLLFVVWAMAPPRGVRPPWTEEWHVTRAGLKYRTDVVYPRRR